MGHQEVDRRLEVDLVEVVVTAEVHDKTIRKQGNHPAISATASTAITARIIPPG